MICHATIDFHLVEEIFGTCPVMINAKVIDLNFLLKELELSFRKGIAIFFEITLVNSIEFNGVRSDNRFKYCIIRSVLCLIVPRSLPHQALDHEFILGKSWKK
jgi:hypothetical protein